MWRYILLTGLSMLLFWHETNGQDYSPAKPRMTQALLKDFIRTHLEYPESSLNQKQEGVVEITFDVDKEGTTSGIRVTKKVSPEIDSAAVSLFRLILWEPAKQYGLSVKSESTFKIRFNIKKYKGWVKKRGYDHIALPYRPVSASLKIYSLKELDEAPRAILQGSYASLQDFIVHQLKMPEDAVKVHITGTVKLRFVIETNGLPSNFQVIEPLGGGCTEEAIRVAQMIRWIPGLVNKEAVRSCYDLTFTFNPFDKLRNKDIPNQSNSGL